MVLFACRERPSKCILRGYVRKLMRTRGFQNIAQNHHRMDDERLFHPDGRLLHYKWTSIILDHLAERIATREQTGRRNPSGSRPIGSATGAHLC